MSYHNITTSAAVRQSITNAQGQTAPAGYHYMPDGSLMLDTEHARLYGGKIIKNFNLDTSDIKAVGEKRIFTILGDRDAIFSLEVTSPEIIFTDATCDYNNDPTIAHDDDNGKIEVGMLVSGTGIPVGATVSNVTSDTAFELSASTTGGSVTNGTLTFTREKKYYNFETGLFQTAKTKLIDASVGGKSYSGSINFPKVTAGAQYDVYLFAESNYGTSHAEYKEVRFPDNSIDINSTTGSNSNLIQKVIYQTLDVTLTLAGYSPNGTVTGIMETQVITTSRNASIGIIPFSFIVTTGTSNTLAINKQPVSSDIMAFLLLTPGATPLDIEGENIYPIVTGTDTVNGDFASGATAITMDAAVAGKMAVGDLITGTGIRNVRENPVTVASLDSTNVFSASESITIDDGITLSFSNQRNYRWSLDNIYGLTPGMRSVAGNFFATQPTIKEYLTQTTVLEGEPGEYKVDNVRVPALDTLGVLPVTTRDGTTKVETTVQTGNVVFSEQALLTFGGGANAKIFSYGTSEIERLTGYDVEFTDLAVALTETTTTTTASSSNSKSVVIADRIGISDRLSTVSGIGINPTISGTDTVNGAIGGGDQIVMDAVVSLTMKVGDRVTGAGIPLTSTVTVKALNPDGDNTSEFSVSENITVADGITLSFSNQVNSNPTVTSGAGSVTGAGTIVLSAVQTLQSGVTLTFPGASTVATITGNIKVNKAGNENVTLRFDLEKFLTMQ